MTIENTTMSIPGVPSVSSEANMSEESGKIRSYKEKQRRRLKDRWVKKNPPGLNRKERRKLVKEMRQTR